jgi:AhpD family alkylhydroperoxidase
MLGLQNYVDHCSIEPQLLDLIKVRASQVNGCAYCIDMHTKEARAKGESEQRLYELDAWRESPFYTDRERAALAWTEAVTLVAATHVPDEIFDATRQQFNEKEIMDLTMAVVAINSWNRLMISFRAVAGSYQVARR